MTSPARRHRQRVRALAAHQAARGGLLPVAESKPYELLLARLDADMRRLKLIQSIEKKVETKREMLPEYAAWIEGALEADSGEPDDILMTVMVWRIDTGDFHGALKIADYALRHGLKLPARYSRTPGCLIAEEFAEAAKKTLDDKRLPDLAALAEAARLTAEADMPDEVRAKVQKAMGLTLELHGQPAQALERLRRALVLNPNAGVKKDIERLERSIKNNPPAQASEGG
ncbi:MAG: hypothetical protein LBU76_01935 [Azoarcus sp.]|jgi:tetratricopeptide (TPR) repeat protein|nr:hypothetical protein [Azoarcus sp.]